MICFLIKKTFFDLWDNLFRMVLVNSGFVVSILIPLFLPGLFVSTPFLGTGILLVGILWCSFYLSAAALSLKGISDYNSFGFADFFLNLKKSWPAGLVFGVIVFVIYMLCFVAIPFYLNIKSIVGIFLAAFVFWIVVTAILALQFFFPVYSRMEQKLLKVVKKCFVIFFDNPMFCIFSLLHNLFLLTICLFPVFIFFSGPAGMLLFLDEGLRLRLLKYDWLQAAEVTTDENAAGADISKKHKRKIPWDTILIEEREKTGSRSLKNLIFPWKD